jgi:hypothetical protein
MGMGGENDTGGGDEWVEREKSRHGKYPIRQPFDPMDLRHGEAACLPWFLYMIISFASSAVLSLQSGVCDSSTSIDRWCIRLPPLIGTRPSGNWH